MRRRLRRVAQGTAQAQALGKTRDPGTRAAGNSPTLRTLKGRAGQGQRASWVTWRSGCQTPEMPKLACTAHSGRNIRTAAASSKACALGCPAGPLGVFSISLTWCFPTAGKTITHQCQCVLQLAEIGATGRSARASTHLCSTQRLPSTGKRRDFLVGQGWSNTERVVHSPT